MTCNGKSRILIAMLVGVALSGCSPHQEPATNTAEAASPAPAAATTIAEKPKPTACAMVTPQEMSAILGVTVKGEPDEGTADQTECVYTPIDAPSPYVEFTVERGDAKEAMAAMGTMGKIEPGMTDPYAGLGDQAGQVGTAMFIRTGDDLVTITFSGVEDVPGTARKIFDTAKPKM